MTHPLRPDDTRRPPPAINLDRLGAVSLRDVPRSPDGGVIADYNGDIESVADLAARLSATPGVVDHGLFAPEMVAVVIVGRRNSVELRNL